jgi:DNA-binding CsgD family transcriptional regulator
VPYLEAAGATFSALGADPWLGRCDRELRACGVTTSHPVDASLRSLTAQELQVTLRVAGGATNREVAAALFLSPRTVESHLASVFRKLDVRTRAELAKRIALISGDSRSRDEE